MVKNSAIERAERLSELIRNILTALADADGALVRTVESNPDARSKHIELKRVAEAVRTFMKTEPEMRYVAFAGAFSSGKTATINNLLGVRGKPEQRPEGTAPVDKHLTLCVHRDRERAILNTLLDASWKAEIYLHGEASLYDVIIVDTPGRGHPLTDQADSQIVHNLLPICDTVVYCFNATNPFGMLDVQALTEMNEVLTHVDFTYALARVDDVFRKDRYQPFSVDNFDRARADNERDDLFGRIREAIGERTVGRRELIFIANDHKFGIPDLAARILLPPSDLTTLALNKVEFFQRRSLHCLIGMLGRLREMRATVTELIAKAEENHREYNEKFEIRTEEIREFWRVARESLRESMGRFKELEPRHVGNALDVNALAQSPLGQGAEIVAKVQQFCEPMAESLVDELWHVTRGDLAFWKANTEERIQSAGFEALGNSEFSRGLQATTSVKLDVAEVRRRLSGECLTFATHNAREARQALFGGLIEACKGYRGDFERAAKHASEGEIFRLEERLRERCHKEVASTIDKYASIIDLYVAGINTAGNMKVIERAALGSEIDFLQAEKIGKEEQQETADRLFENIFGEDLRKISAIGTKCELFPEQLRALSREAQSWASEGHRLEADPSPSQPKGLTEFEANFSSLWDKALQPVVTQYETASASQRAELITNLVQRYGETTSNFEAQKRRQIGDLTRFVRLGILAGVAVITIGFLVTYNIGWRVGQTVQETVFWGAIGNACCAVAGEIYRRMNLRAPRWAARRSDYFRYDGQVALAAFRKSDAAVPRHLTEYRDAAVRSLVSAMIAATAAATTEVVTLADDEICDVEDVRARGRALINDYQKSWEEGRATIDSMYRETNNKIEQFRAVAATFKERTMDRTRELFGNRARALDHLISQLESLGKGIRTLDITADASSNLEVST